MHILYCAHSIDLVYARSHSPLTWLDSRDSQVLIDPFNTPSIPNYKTFDFFDLKFDHLSYKKDLQI